MTQAEIDLSSCAEEPIRIPGAIQPHGLLLGVHKPSLEVVLASTNAAALLGVDHVLGRPLAALVPDEALASLSAASNDPNGWSSLAPWEVDVGSAAFEGVVSQDHGLVVIELEPLEGASRSEGRAWYSRLRRGILSLQGASSEEVLTDQLAAAVADLTGFDRVMIYRFDAEWNGEVVAERHHRDVEPFLGLHFPATDIPAQARALYLSNWLRLIPDAAYRAVPLHPDVNPLTGRPLDLGGTSLRSVSPVHLAYLRNMGVVASMSISLIVHGQLWGLIACHHYRAPLRPSWAVRSGAEFLGRTASVLLGALEHETTVIATVRTSTRSAVLTSAVAASGSRFAAALSAPAGDGSWPLLELADATGAAVRVGDDLRLVGATPDAGTVAELAAALLGQDRGASPGAVAVESMEALDPQWDRLRSTAAGVLAIDAGSPGDYVLWFRPEVVRTVTWGGNPSEHHIIDIDGQDRIGPRRSFQAWRDSVRGRALPWHPAQVAAARDLAGALADVARHHRQVHDEGLAALQRTLLVDEPPRIETLGLATRYLPSGTTPFGGDWYDLVFLPNDRVVIVLGDVAGHGFAAASTTAQLRHALRAYLLKEPSPGAALERLNELTTVLLPQEMATVVVVELDLSSALCRLASAGHLPGIATGREGEVRVLDVARGPALGLRVGAIYANAEVDLRESVLVLFSDGLIERRDRSLDDGYDSLRQVIRSWRESAAAPASDAALAGLCDLLCVEADPARADDVTVVALAPRARGI